MISIFKQRNNLFNQARLRLLFYYFAGIVVDSIDTLINYRNHILQTFVNYVLNDRLFLDSIYFFEL